MPSPLSNFASCLHLCAGTVQMSLLIWDCGPVLSSLDLRIWLEPGSWLGSNLKWTIQFSHKLLPEALTALLPILKLFLGLLNNPALLKFQPRLWLPVHFLKQPTHHILFFSIIKVKMTYGFSPNFPKCLPHWVITSWWSSLSTEQSFASPPWPSPTAYTRVQNSCFLQQAPQMFPDFINEWLHGFGTILLCLEL